MGRGSICAGSTLGERLCAVRVVMGALEEYF